MNWSNAHHGERDAAFQCPFLYACVAYVARQAGGAISEVDMARIRGLPKTGLNE